MSLRMKILNWRLNTGQTFNSVVKMSVYCRLCAEIKDESEITTSINDPERLTEQKLIACCQWNPQNTEFELPQDVCALCFDKLENCWSFLQSVQSSQRKIQRIFGEIHLW